MGIKRNNCFARKVVIFQESIDYHREITPPDRVTKIDGIISG